MLKFFLISPNDCLYSKFKLRNEFLMGDPIFLDSFSPQRRRLTTSNNDFENFSASWPKMMSGDQLWVIMIYKHFTKYFIYKPAWKSMFYRSSLPFLEVNIMWAGHQTHHSSEDYNLTTALRQSTFHRYISWVK